MRWTAAKKLDVVCEVTTSQITFEQACNKYDISHEELLNWIERIATEQTLKATRRTMALL